MSGTTTPAPTPAGVVPFDYTAWSTRYPQFAATVSSAQAALYWEDAGAYCNNTAASVVKDLAVRKIILNLLTAHLAELGVRASTGGLMGRITNVSEGSVSVGSEYQLATPRAAWYAQTPYGAAAWEAMAPYRTFQFVAGPPTFPVRRW